MIVPDDGVAPGSTDGTVSRGSKAKLPIDPSWPCRSGVVTVDELATSVDEGTRLETPADSRAVGRFDGDFDRVPDEEAGDFET